MKWHFGAGRFRHRDAQEADWKRCSREFDCPFFRGVVVDNSIWKCRPNARGRFLHRMVAGPVLDFVRLCEWHAPFDFHVRHRLDRSKIKDDPLGMSRVRLPREFAREVRITFPERLGITVGDAGIAALCAAVARMSAVRERVTVGMTYRFFQFSATREVSTLIRSIAPSAVWIPVPGANRELGILTIGDR